MTEEFTRPSFCRVVAVRDVNNRSSRTVRPPAYQLPPDRQLVPPHRVRNSLCKRAIGFSGAPVITTRSIFCVAIATTAAWFASRSLFAAEAGLLAVAGPWLLAFAF